MENPRGPPPCESRESDEPSEPIDLDESNKIEVEADGPQADTLEADEPEADDEFDGGEFDLDMFDLDDYAREEFEADNFGALGFEGYDFDAVAEPEADDAAAEPEADESDLSTDYSLIMYTRHLIYSSERPNCAYTAYARFGELVKKTHRGPDGRLMFAFITQKFRRNSMVYTHDDFGGDGGVQSGMVNQEVSSPVARHGGFITMVARTETQAYYNESDIFFVQELTIGTTWRRNRDGPPPPPEEINRFSLAPIPV
ncbi:hypothetical protein GGI35DRAFT_486942 [Trichoderma velutinum]